MHAQVWVHGIDKVLVPMAQSNNTQAAGNAGMNMGVAGSASAGAANAGVSGSVSPNGADADVQTSGNDGSRRLMRRLFMLAHKARLV